MKLTLVGKGEGWERAYRDSKEAGRVIWCVSTVFEKLAAVDVQPDLIFQLHGRELFEPWLKEVQDRVVLARPEPGYSQARLLPVGELLGAFGPRFSSSFAWMLALAIFEGAQEIRFHGVHLSHDSEYKTQRDAFFYFCGFAESRGIRVETASDSGIFILGSAYGVTP